VKLASPDDLTAFLGLTRDSSNYPALVLLEDSIEVSLAAYVGLDLENVTRTVDVQLTGKMIPLSALPVSSVSSITLSLFSEKGGSLSGRDFSASNYGTGAMTLTLQPSDYLVTNYGIRTFLNYGSGIATITYNGGLTATNGIMDMPAPSAKEYRLASALKKAALLQIAYEYTRKDNIGATSVSSEGGRTAYPEDALLKSVTDLLNEFKHPLTGLI